MKGRVFSLILGFFTILTTVFVSKSYASSSFPSCNTPSGSLMASYSEGAHGIVGDTSTHTGSDSVYALNSSQVLQCFCGNGGGIQTNWLKISNWNDVESLQSQGWYYVPNGEAWGLDNEAYMAQNVSYSCGGGNNGNSNNNGGGLNGGNGGGNASAPVCNDPAPTSAPVITNISYGNNSATITWTKASDPVTYYLLAYGTQSGVYTYGNPNIGDANTTSYTVKGLSAGTYYFVVRAGNGCKPGPFSNEVSVDPPGQSLSTTPEGFSYGVLGSSVSSTAGASAKFIKFVSQTCSECIWWQILLGEFMILVILYGFLNKWTKNNKARGYIKYLVPVLTYVIFLILNHSCTFNAPWWQFWKWQLHFIFWGCKYFWLLDLVLFGVLTLIFRRRNSKISKK